jgi:predicted peptidase
MKVSIYHLTGLFFVFFIMACATTAARAENEDFEARVYRGEAGQSLPYQLLKPAHYDPKVSYPLVLFLHGAGERGEDNKAPLVHVVSIFDTPENREKYPCFVVVPQCPLDQRWVEVDWSEPAHDQPKEPSGAMALTVKLLESLPKEFSIDPKREYVLGISMGGFGTWDMIARYPEMFAAAAPICGGGDEKTAACIAKLPIWAFHGAADTVVKTDRSRHMIEALKKAGGEPRYTEYPGCGHNSWDLVVKEPALLSWLFAQKRTP